MFNQANCHYIFNASITIRKSSIHSLCIYVHKACLIWYSFSTHYCTFWLQLLVKLHVFAIYRSICKQTWHLSCRLQYFVVKNRPSHLNTLQSKLLAKTGWIEGTHIPLNPDLHFWILLPTLKSWLKGTVPPSSGARISRLTQGPLMSSSKHFRWRHNCKAA